MDDNTKKVMFSSGKDDYGTPQDFYDICHQEFKFTLDVCATEDNSKCAQYFGWKRGMNSPWVLVDGLKRSWNKNVCWCNPPYSDIKSWMAKAVEASQAGATVAILVPARTDTKWFHGFGNSADEIRFLKGRLKFQGASAGAPFPSMLLIYRPKPAGLVGRSPTMILWDWRK